MRLTDYLDRYSWSQSDLAREAGISVQSVKRALDGESITRRNANAIVTAIDLQWAKQGGNGHVVLTSQRGKYLI